MMVAFAGLCHRGGETPTAQLTFTHTGDGFEPLIAVSDGATVQWETSEGDESSAVDPSFDFGTAEERTTTLSVYGGDLLMVNVGYNGDDGGITSSVATDLLPDGSDPEGYAATVRDNQNVTAIGGLDSAASTLRVLTLSRNPLTGLDLTNFVALERLEAYRDLPDSGGLETVTLTGCGAVRRLCLENNQATTMDLSLMTLLEDVRGANQPLTSVSWPSGTLANLWHICVRESASPLTFPALSDLPAIRDYYVTGTGQAGTIDFSGNSDTIQDIWVSRNAALEGVVLTDCSDITYFEASDCNFDEAAVDYVLTTIDAFATSGTGIVINGNVAPSVAGLAAVASLEGRGWTVTHD